MFLTIHRVILPTSLLVFGLLLAGCQTTGSSSNETGSADDRQTIVEATADERAAAIEAGERLLADIDRRLEEMGQEIDEASDDAKARWAEERKRLSALRRDAAESLEDLRESSGSAWERVKRGFSEAYDDLATAVEAAREEYRS